MRNPAQAPHAPSAPAGCVMSKGRRTTSEEERREAGTGHWVDLKLLPRTQSDTELGNPNTHQEDGSMDSRKGPSQQV